MPLLCPVYYSVPAPRPFCASNPRPASAAAAAALPAASAPRCQPRCRARTHHLSFRSRVPPPPPRARYAPRLSLPSLALHPPSPRLPTYPRCRAFACRRPAREPTHTLGPLAHPFARQPHIPMLHVVARCPIRRAHNTKVVNYSTVS